MITENPRKYGNKPYNVVLVHGGPGAPGEIKAVAEKLSQNIGVLEPLQTKNSVEGQVRELKQQIIRNTNAPVILVGWSWGAWLSFIVAAENPSLIKKLILVSSGPFEAKYAKKIMPTRFSRLSSVDAEKVNVLMSLFQSNKASDKDLKEFGKLMSKADSFDSLEENRESVEIQSYIYEKVWKEAEKMRKSGELLNYGKRITCPVVVIHGDYDSHPFEGVKEPLSRTLKNVRFVLLKNCGHRPWLEKKAKNQFYTTLKQEL